MEIYITLAFDAAHKLPLVPPGHKCGNLHGHTFTVEIWLSGQTSANTGWIQDFGEIKAIASQEIGLLDHKYLNEIAGLENPTSETIAAWLWQRLKPRISELSKIVVKETPNSGAVYTGPD